MSEINPCPKCGSMMSESYDIVPVARRVQVLGNKYLHCTNGDCDVESERYDDSDEGIRKWNALTGATEAQG